MRTMKKLASETMNATAETAALSGGGFSFSATSVSREPGWERSQSGRRLRTGGTRSKLWGLGGDVVAHSSVHASHGLSPATAPFRRLLTMLATKRSVDSAMMNAPTVDAMLSAPHPGRSGYVKTRRGIPM